MGAKLIRQGPPGVLGAKFVPVEACQQSALRTLSWGASPIRGFGFSGILMAQNPSAVGKGPLASQPVSGGGEVGAGETRMAESEETRMVAEVRQKLSKVEGRDIQLWSINLLTLLVVAAGLAALLLPKLIWNLESLHLDARYLPQLFFGFISLIVLFNIYTLQQRRTLRETRDELMRQLLRTVAAEKLSLIDPLTQVFNRRYMEEILAKEVSRAERRGSALTFLVIDVDRFKSVNTRFGHLGGDRLLNSVAQLLTSTFRKSDTVVRSGGDEFVAILPDTNEQQATRVWERLLAKVNDWNRENSLPGYNLSLSCGLSTYTKGADVKDLLEKADKRMYLQKADRTALA